MQSVQLNPVPPKKKKKKNNHKASRHRITQSLVFRQLLRHQLKNGLLNLLAGTISVDGQRIPFALGFLESLQLRVDHAALHIVGGITVLDALDQDVLVQLEINEVDLNRGGPVGGDAHDVSIFLFEGGTGDYNAGRRVEVVGLRRGEGLDGGFAQGDEPVPAVFVG